MSRYRLWDIRGKMVEGENPPLVKPDVLAPEQDSDQISLDFDYSLILEKLKDICHSEIVSLLLLADNHYTVLEAVSAEDARYIIRVARAQTEEDVEEHMVWQRDKLKRENAMMCWMASATAIPLPKVYYCDPNAPAPYMITEKCEGLVVIGNFGLLNEEQKLTHLRSYASIALDFFRTTCPQYIGSVTDYQKITAPVVGPLFDPNGNTPPPAAFSSTAGYFSWLIARRKSSSAIGDTDDAIKEAHDTLDALESFLIERLDELDPALLRCIPSHDDFGPQNVFISSDGHISALIDWEFHSVKPAILVVNYPNWLRTYVDYNAPEDPDGQFTIFNMEDPKVAERLRGEYDRIVQAMEPDYFRALKEGSIFRSAEKWLKDPDAPDPGCRALYRWLYCE